MGVFGGEHLGFSYGGVRSENLGMVRTIDNRYSYTLAPPIKDVTAEVPNYNGVYFWGSNYDRRNITIPFAFDEINETQLSRIKKILNSKKVQELVFDEDPSIIYPAMVANTSTLSFLCFDIMGKRVYRGEGSLNFICHTPYKRSKYKFAEELKEFRGAAALFKNEEGYLPSAKLYVANQDWSSLRELYAEGYNDDLDGTTIGIAPGKIYRLGYSTLPSNKVYGNFTGQGYALYNAGVIDIPFQIYFEVDESEKVISIQNSNKFLVVKAKAKIYNAQDPTCETDKYIKIDTNNYTIVGCDANHNPTGTLYNDCIAGGTFFNLVPGRNDLITMVDNKGAPAEKIDYQYKFI